MPPHPPSARLTIDEVVVEYRFLSKRHLREFVRKKGIPALSTGKRHMVDRPFAYPRSRE